MIGAHRCHYERTRPESSSAARSGSISAANRGKRTRLANAAMSSATFALALVVPKCPLCVAAWAAAMGAGVAAQRTLGAVFTPGLRLLGVGLLALPLTLQLALFLSARLRRMAGARGASCSAEQDDLLRAASPAPKSR